MERIESFSVNHEKLMPGLYVSRRDQKDGVVVTTFDIRMVCPNIEPAMDSSAMHTIEHIGATYLRNSKKKDDIIYFGPMGCKTGFYLVVFGEVNSVDVVDLVKETFSFIEEFEGEIPGTTEKECGNCYLQNLKFAKYYASMYLDYLSEYAYFEYEE